MEIKKLLRCYGIRSLALSNARDIMVSLCVIFNSWLIREGFDHTSVCCSLCSCKGLIFYRGFLCSDACETHPQAGPAQLPPGLAEVNPGLQTKPSRDPPSPLHPSDPAQQGDAPTAPAVCYISRRPSLTPVHWSSGEWKITANDYSVPIRNLTLTFQTFSGCKPSQKTVWLPALAILHTSVK